MSTYSVPSTVSDTRDTQMNKTWFLPSTVSNVEERLTARWQELLSAVTKMYKTVFIVFILVGWKLSAHGLAASCGRKAYL